MKRSLASELLVRRNPLVYPRARRLFLELSSCSLDERAERVNGLLSRVLRIARLSDYGRRMITGETVLSSWPLLSKSTVQLAPESFHVSGYLPVSRASTGGTTGAPLALLRSLSSLAVEQAAIDFSLNLAGIAARNGRIAILRADSIKSPSDRSPPYWSYAASGRQMILSSQHLDQSTLPNFVAAIRKFQPSVLWVYPSALESLCLLLERSGEALRIPCVLSSSEMMSAELWQVASQKLDCKIVDYYGQAERVAFAVATDIGRYRFLPGYSFVEFHPVRVEGNHSIWEIIGTSLWNERMPLIRYRTGDMISLPSTLGSKELAEVALGVREFDGVIGRAAEYLVSPTGSRIIGLNHLPRGVDHLLRLQLIQESRNEVSILVRATSEFSVADSEKLKRNINQKFPESIRWSVRRVEILESTPSGKCPFVIRRPGVEGEPSRSKMQ